MADDEQDPTRRGFLAGSAAVLGSASIIGTAGCTPSQHKVLQTASQTPPAGASLADVRHIVLLMQENRSFDHYFGTLSGTRGFSDPGAPRRAGRPVFDQAGYQPGTGVDPSGFLQPFRLVSKPPREDGQATNDIAHDWVTQHRSWNNGAMDSFVAAHLAADGRQNGPLTMGYYSRADLPFYHALADAFTVCDGYFCSVLGPTDPNRVMAMSGTIDPAGGSGGPVLTTREGLSRLARYGSLRWETMPERLLDAGVSWKVYSDPLGLLALSPLPYFRAFASPVASRGRELVARGITPTYPDSFKDDVASGKLPAVSWIIPPLAQCEHPAAPPDFGEHLVSQVLSTLVAHPAVWASTVLLVVYDENGGFFDHLPPPTAPAGTPGEYLTGPLPSAAGGVAGPVGLGFRTPCLVVSPFSRGGYRYSGTLDHTSVLRLIEKRFAVPVPNLSAWRRTAVGDFTGALSLGHPSDVSVPRLPATGAGDTKAAEQAVLNALAGTADVGIPYPLPAVNQMPSQEAAPRRPPVP